MSIKISTEKVVTSDGVKSRKILNIECLSCGELPKLYLNGKDPIVFKSSTDLSLILRNAKNLSYCLGIGFIYPEDLFKEIIEHISKAGKHLKRVNEELSLLEKKWSGQTTYII